MGKPFKDRDWSRTDNKPSRQYRHAPEYRTNSITKTKCGMNGKVGFYSYDDAIRRSNEITTSDKLKGGATQLRVYQCEFCKLYHITKQMDYKQSALTMNNLSVS
jgi:hypothetical protein